MKEKERGILPQKIKGFRDIDSDLNQLRWNIINKAKEVYKSYGFEQLDTPILEYADTLGKYMPDKESVEEGIYSFQNPEKEPVYLKNGEEMRDENENVIMENHFLALRYDLTAPLSRFYAEKLWKEYLRGNIKDGKAPLFRRYQFGQVFRYELKLTPGRFREFWQLDFDTIGTADVSADAEVCIILADALEKIGLKRKTYIVKVNNRKILKGFLQAIGINSENDEQNILRIIDKFDKIGFENVKKELMEGRTDDSGSEIKGIGMAKDTVEKIMGFFNEFSKKSTREEVLKKLKKQFQDNKIYNEGIEELEKMHFIWKNLNFSEERIIFDCILVRGMAYYTGPIFEVESLQTYKDKKGRKRNVGSICGGGRYDNLVKNLLGIKVPATGASIGVDRLSELLTLTKQVPEKEIGSVFITVFDDELMPEYQKIARSLREKNIKTEIFYGFQRNLKKQLKYADRKNSPIAIMLGSNELEKGIVTVKDLRMGRKMQNIKDKKIWREKVQFQVKREKLIEKVLELLKY